MSDTRRRLNADGTLAGYDAATSSGDLESSRRLARASTTAGSGLGSRGSGGSDMPKQKDGESAAEYGNRLRAYREKKRDAKESAAQKSALRNLN
jgi:hypothetical protein